MGEKLGLGLVKKNPYLRNLARSYVSKRRLNHYMTQAYPLPVQDNMVFFESFFGRSYSCSPKAIYKAMLQDSRFENYTFVWAFRDPEKYADNPDFERAILVKSKSPLYYQYYAQAKYWFTNSRAYDWISKKDQQVYVQCWHGTPWKRLGLDIKVDTQSALNTTQDIWEKYIYEGKLHDWLLSPSPYTTERLGSAFGHADHSKIIERGYPRNDYLYNYTNDDIKRIKNELGIDDSKKVILYAPTWRDDQHKANVGYTYQPEINFDLLRNELGDEYVVLFRAHYFVANSFDFAQYKDFVYNVSEIDDINELYVISDLLITDYSSVFFDYSNLRRPIIFHLYDYQHYAGKLRGFYFGFDELPGPITQTDEELIKAIKTLNEYEEKYGSSYKAFNEKFTPLDDGHASERVIESVFGN